MSLPELLIGSLITLLILTGITSIVFTTNNLQRAAADQSRLSGDLAVLSLAFDRDAAMATTSAPARSQTFSTSCASAVDLGFVEGGASVRYKMVSSATRGPNWLQRISGAGTLTVARDTSACTWRVESDPSGRLTIRLDVTLAGPTGESLSQTLRGAPRLW